ncbi:unnamed protein product [Adineta ricciae]|uniref:Microbial-type PARG catalytic domain-containing protein n=1 Tax=Adineta ricciae TaxID=249248 RepID=A0A814EEB8_ADIRI|nr:unnamed protein product [Adineta ricciae]CAF1410213.1 unnamed protein product [Adineta ricciae]
MSSDSDSDSQVKPSPLGRKENLLVYVPDLPIDYPGDDLQGKLRSTIEKTGRMKLKNVQCHLKLGVAIVELNNEEDQTYLLSDGQSMMFDRELNISISFVDTLDLDTYIVVDQTMSKIPSGTDISRRYMQIYKIKEEYPCESISTQFPNIFRISLNDLDELLAAVAAPNFKIGNHFAQVYPRADCNFFEDLPSTSNTDKITSVVATQIDETKLPSTCFYIQYDKETSNAVVIATKASRKWKTQGFIIIDGQNFSKKAKLAYRVIVSPVPNGFDINRILQHTLFTGQVRDHSLVENHLIIELNDVHAYSHCMEIGALRIDKFTMEIKPHRVDRNPDQCEITAENWYETAMLDAEPDITTIMNNLQHPILHYKWNAQNWIEQFNKAEEKRSKQSKYDRVLHLLRVTVMLNTIAILRKQKYVVDGQEVTLNLQRLKTIGYDHRSKLLDGKTIMQTELKIPYESTTVHVVMEDCLVVYEKLVSQGHKPLLLNMANATSPGGGYRKGDGAQEENLFRRSDYYQSLDFEIANKDRSEPLFCNEKGACKKPTGYRGFYPMELFGAIYTSGITVFRQREKEEGYAYMAKPLTNVCSVAMAAYRDPTLNKNSMLEDKFAVNTHKKIESIFAIGHQHGHNCLVLSAFGCGAFKNPPEHIALLFKSVITQYAGYFHEIYFAIIDDHNSKGKINPDGNFAPFHKCLHNQVFRPPATLRVNGISGPYRILNKSSDGQLTLSDVRILHKSPCHHGSRCRDLRNAQHCNEFSHPPICSHQNTESPCQQTDDEVHRFTFQHSSKCKFGGECKDTDPKHFSEYDHPDFCKDNNYCVDMSKEHLFSYRHLPICRDGMKCVEYLKRNADHCTKYRHCKTICPRDNCCVQFHDKDHTDNTIHSFRQPCPFTPYSCQKYIKYTMRTEGEKLSQDVEKHCLTYSHLCAFGRQCKTKDSKHLLTSIHIARHICPDGDACAKSTNEQHLESYSHPRIRDFRLFCKFPGFKCRNRFEHEHLRKFRHGDNHDHLTVAPSSNLNSSINFTRNQGDIIRNLNSYMDASGWKKASISREVRNWIQALQPTHRCSPLIFESILVLGHVMSRRYMELLKKPKNVAKAVLQHGRIRRIFLEHSNPEVKQNVYELIKLIVVAEFAKAKADEVPPLDADHDVHIHNIERKLKPPLDDTSIKVIHERAVEIAQA